MFLGQIADSASSFHDLLSSSDHLTYVKVLHVYYSFNILSISLIVIASA